MGARKRKYRGVERISESTVRIKFSYLGRAWREIETIKTGNESVEHEACKNAESLYLLIKQTIKSGKFNYQDFFPKSSHLLEVDRLLGRTSNKISTKDYCLQWCDEHERHVATGTINEYRLIINNRWSKNPETDISNIPFVDLTFDETKKMADAWGNTTHTIYNKLSPLSCSLEKAVRDKVIPFDWLKNQPIIGIDKDLFDGDKEDDHVDPFNKQERPILIDGCKHQQDRNIFLFLMWTGLRPSEAVVLKWTDIDFDKGFIVVRKAKPDKEPKVKTTKTKSSKRKVKINADSLNALLSQKDYTYNLGTEVIFNNPNTDKPWRVDKLRDHWLGICKHTGVTYRYPYQLRHTYATMMVMSGEKIEWISKMMGHKSVLHTWNTYSRWIDDDAPDSGDKASSLFSIVK